jgi:hypothetical protein
MRNSPLTERPFRDPSGLDLPGQEACRKALLADNLTDLLGGSVPCQKHPSGNGQRIGQSQSVLLITGNDEFDQ